MNLPEAQVAFKSFLETEGRRRKTIVKYIGILDRFIGFAKTQGIVNTKDVKLTLIDNHRAERGKSLSPKSMHHEGSLLKLFFAWCAERRTG